MNRRKFVTGGIAGAAGTVIATVSVRARAENRTTDSAATPPAFELDELTIADLQAGMSSGKYTAQSLTRKYLDRIDDIDKRGPAVNSVIELNPDAQSIAAEHGSRAQSRARAWAAARNSGSNQRQHRHA